jgi:hypothetical protein
MHKPNESVKAILYGMWIVLTLEMVIAVSKLINKGW